MIAAIPVIEIADDTDALGVGRPDGKACAGDAVDGAELAAELVVDASFVAFTEQIKIRFAQSREEGIGIASAMDLTGLVRDDKVIGIDTAAVLSCAFENITFRDTLEFNRGLVLFVNRLDFDFGGVWYEGAGNETGTVVEGMEAEQTMRRVGL